jgi:hypothetical protein
MPLNQAPDIIQSATASLVSPQEGCGGHAEMKKENDAQDAHGRWGYAPARVRPKPHERENATRAGRQLVESQRNEAVSDPDEFQTQTSIPDRGTIRGLS